MSISFSRSHIKSTMILSAFALLALGSGSKPAEDKSAPTKASATTAASPAGEAVLGSCSKPRKKKCLEWIVFVNDEKAAKQTCESEGGAWSNTGCPSDNTLVGTCLVKETRARYKEYEYRFEKGVYEPKEGCVGSGSQWTDGPSAAAAVSAPPAASTGTAKAKAAAPKKK